MIRLPGVGSIDPSLIQSYRVDVGEVRIPSTVFPEITQVKGTVTGTAVFTDGSILILRGRIANRFAFDFDAWNRRERPELFEPRSKESPRA